MDLLSLFFLICPVHLSDIVEITKFLKKGLSVSTLGFYSRIVLLFRSALKGLFGTVRNASNAGCVAERSVHPFGVSLHFGWSHFGWLISDIKDIHNGLCIKKF